MDGRGERAGAAGRAGVADARLRRPGHSGVHCRLDADVRSVAGAALKAQRSIHGLLMHVHILGICGTFMGGIAAIAKAAGHKVTGSDRNVYPPMSTQLRALGIELVEGFEAAQLDIAPDVVVVGNVMTRGVPVVEALLDRGLPFASGPEWLAREVLQDRWVIAVAGTHCQTTTTSLVAWRLEYSGLAPGFLIGGVPENFASTARLGAAP